MQKKVLSVTQINEYIKLRMDRDPNLNSVAVRGEISNFKPAASGHSYFTLKDESGALKCAMFKSSAAKLRFRPKDGMKVIAMGSVSVYAKNGEYQLTCTSMAMDGIGDLYAAFEELKSRLSAQGLFDPSHKKPIPRYPRVIGIVTSPTGAAIHDMLRILRARYPLTRVRLLPVRVQGVEAPAEIAGAIAFANHHQVADLLIVGRGGGSIEDLWAFNEEIVARAIYASRIPVISAVGHEPDVTIADYVADLRAATPSNAAELAVPDRNALCQYMDSLADSMEQIQTRRLNLARQALQSLSNRPVLLDPMQSFEQKRKALESLQARLAAACNSGIQQRQRRFALFTGKLDALSPLKVLTRGYSLVSNEEGLLIRSTRQVTPGQAIRIRVSDGIIQAKTLEGVEYDDR